MGLLWDCRVFCLGLTELGKQPKHPLYVPADRPFERFELVEERKDG